MNRRKGAISLFLIAIMLLSMPMASYAQTPADDQKAGGVYLTLDQVGPAIGPPPPVPEGYYEKVAAAERYYRAKMAGDYELAADILMKSRAARGATARSRSSALMTASLTENRIDSMKQCPQETGSWCGFASLESVIEATGRSTSQTAIVKAITGRSTADHYASLGWYTTDGTDWSHFPSVKYLNGLNLGFTWAPSPMGVVGSNPLTTDQVLQRVVSTIDDGWGCMALGESTPTNKLHYLYPNDYIGHWVAIDGYYNRGHGVRVADPARSDAVQWKTKPPPNYSVSLGKITSFVEPRGIIW